MDKQGGGGEGEVTCLRSPLSHRQAKLHQCKDLYINGLTLDITVKIDV